ncbi:MAG: ABC transporter permease, partial [Romboutsia sp.]|uniref:ABC transporter permease n=1 Tax=Romboutsia sp. TaxID=1965302 RepID=UPI003F3069D0
MLHNNNQEIIKKLSRRSFKINKIRNFVTVLAIVLTTVFFTSLFTVGYSMLEAFNSFKMMEYGTDKHVQLQDITEKQIEIIKNNESIDKDSIGIVKNIESLKNPELSTQTVNLAVYDEQSVEGSVNVEMVEGSLPKNKDEIVMPIEVLDMLKIPHKIGANVKIELPQVKDGGLTGKKQSFTFKLSGYFKYKTATAMPLHDIYTSDAFYNEYKKTNEIGATCVTFNFISDKNLQEQFDKLLNELQPYHGKASITPVYLDSQVTNVQEVIKNALPIVLIMVLILLSGYLLIYNIFYISVVKDIKHYGLLKTIGTSPTQIKKLIINQANRLCLIAIPIGLLLGFGLGVVFVPMVGSFMDGLNRSSFEYFNPVIFIGATIFSYMTVRVSCKKPAKIASNVSPIDAVRYSDRSSNSKRKFKKGRSGSKIHKMAFLNMFRNKRKAFLVLVSMSLSCMIFLAVSTIISSSDPKRAADGMMLGDIEIHHGYANFAKYEEGIKPIDDKLIKDIENIDGVKRTQRIYKDGGRVAYEGDFKDEVLTQEIEEEHKKQYLQGREIEEMGEFHGFLTLDVTGVSSGRLLNQILESNLVDFYGETKIIQGFIDEDKFNKGGYAIIWGHENSKIKVGDKISFKYLDKVVVEDGYVEHELEVMAIIGGAKNSNLEMFVNENDFKNIVKVPYIQKLIVDVDGNTEEIEKKILDLNEKYNNPYTKLYSKSIYIDDAKETQAMITI